MLKELKFVQGAVAKKDFLPAMTHFAIKDGVVRAYNGTIALSSPIPFDIDCKPKASDLVKAIALCKDTITLSMTAAGRLKVQSGTFKTFIDCVDNDTAHPFPEGEILHEFNGDLLLDALSALSPFIGDDASRPWSNGVLIKGASAFATNNVIAVEYWIGINLPHAINLPNACIKELLRIKEAPESLQIGGDSVTFHYSDGRWVRSQLLGVKEWPDVTALLNKKSNPIPLHDGLFEALEFLKPFVDKAGRVYISGDNISTVYEDQEEGASFEVAGFNVAGIYSLEMLNCLRGTVTSIDWTMYPKPCLFFGDKLRGAIVGLST